MANGQGPVSFGTQMIMSGTRQAHRGAATAAAAGLPANVQNSIMQQGAMIGAEQAYNIHGRFMQKQFENIYKLEIQPLIGELRQMQHARDEALQASVMPIPRQMGAPEYQELSDSLQGQTKMETVPGKANKEGVQSQEAVPQHVPGPNAALGAEVGATEYTEALAYIDKANPNSPAPVDSARGFAIMQEEDTRFWQGNQRIHDSIMGVLSKYSGNPYVNRYGEKMLDNIVKQSNLATTGETEGGSAAEKYKAHQEWTVEQELRQQEVETGRQAIESGAMDLGMKRSQLEDTNVNKAIEMLQTEGEPFEKILGSELTQLLSTGQAEDLDRNQHLQITNAINTFEGDREKAWLSAQKGGLYAMPRAVLEDPAQWPLQLGLEKNGDPGFRRLYNDNIEQEMNRTLTTLSQEANSGEEGKARVAAQLRQHNANINIAEMDRFVRHGDASEAVQLAVRGIVTSGDFKQKANDLALLERIPQLERDRRLERKITAGVEEIAYETDPATGELLHTQAESELIIARRYVPFFQSVLNRKMPPHESDLETERRVVAWGRRWGVTSDEMRAANLPTYEEVAARGGVAPRPSVEVPGTGKPAQEPRTPGLKVLTKLPKALRPDKPARREPDVERDEAKRLEEIKTEITDAERKVRRIEAKDVPKAKKLAQKERLSPKQALARVKADHSIEVDAELQALNDQISKLSDERAEIAGAKESRATEGARQSLRGRIENVLQDFPQFHLTLKRMLKDYGSEYGEENVRAVAKERGIK